ncbi:MAG: alpha/beta hydrolase [Anaerolineae bacterium]|nr:alpha/beta hydrolase [Anaerolineae bacterium]
MDSYIERWEVCNGLRLHLLEWGGDEFAVPMILLHGLASSSHMFDLIAPQLTKRFRVFAVDQRGHGLSDKPVSGYDFEALAGDLDVLLEKLVRDEQPVLIGHSWGAYTTLYYAATRPGRLKRAVLLDGGIRRIADTYPTWFEAEKGMSPPRYRNRSLDDIATMIRDEWLRDIFRPELLPLALSIFDASDPSDVHAHLSFENHVQIAHALWSFEPAAYYPRLQCPVLIVNAVSDESALGEVRRYTSLAAQNLEKMNLVWMHDTIHDIPWHRPDMLLKVFGLWL